MCLYRKTDPPISTGGSQTKGAGNVRTPYQPKVSFYRKGWRTIVLGLEKEHGHIG